MIKPVFFENEKDRLNALEKYLIVDTINESDYDDLTKLASDICQTPIGLISLIDETRQWFKSHHGLDATETSRDIAFCSHAIMQPNEVFIIEDSTKDIRFFDNPLVVEKPNVIFYIGVPLVNPDGFALGTLCAIDHKPRKLSENQISSLKIIANQVVKLFELRKTSIIQKNERAILQQTEKQFRLVVESAPNAMILVNKYGEIKMTNKQAEKQFRYTSEELFGLKLEILIPQRFRNNHPEHLVGFMKNPETRSMGTGRDLFALRKDGSEFPAEIGLNPIEMTDEKLVLASIIDITERKKHENEILLKNQKLADLSNKLHLNNLELEKKNNDVKESIDYAKKIQFSILPELCEIEKHFGKVVIYFEPKNVIGGDFYWFFHREQISYFAVVDCTGHSVPGALMSMIVHSLLNEIMLVNQYQIPGEILGELHYRLYRYLQQEKGDEYSQDGCDISLCKIDHINKILQFSGARQDAYIFKEKNCTTLKATSKSIGGLSLLGKPEPNRIFKTETIEIVENMVIALTTDGILDQLNENDDVFGTKKFINMIAENNHLEKKNQCYELFDTIRNWKKNTVQQDDMLMMVFTIDNSMSFS